MTLVGSLPARNDDNGQPLGSIDFSVDGVQQDGYILLKEEEPDIKITASGATSESQKQMGVVDFVTIPLGPSAGSISVFNLTIKSDINFISALVSGDGSNQVLMDADSNVLISNDTL